MTEFCKKKKKKKTLSPVEFGEILKILWHAKQAGSRQKIQYTTFLYPNTEMCNLHHMLKNTHDRFVQDSSLCALEIRDNVRDKFFMTTFFSGKFFFQQNFFLRFFLGLNFVSDWIMSRITFCCCISYAIV